MCDEDCFMGNGRVRIRRTIAEKRRIVELTLLPGASVARVAQAEGVNANQVFQWRRCYRAGRLSEGEEEASALLPVVVSGKREIERRREWPRPAGARGTIHIELLGRALISVESGADSAMMRAILESLRR